jgi:hypothetical protein
MERDTVISGIKPDQLPAEEETKNLNTTCM